MRLIAHGLPGKVLPVSLIGNMPRIVVSNGPLFTRRGHYLDESHAQGLTALKKRFLANDVRLGENLELLRQGEGVVIVDGDPFYDLERPC